MLIQDGIRLIRNKKGNDKSMILHEVSHNVFFSTNGSSLNPMIPLYTEIDAELLLSDQWEIMTEDEFEENHREQCEKIEKEFFGRRWFSE